MVGGIGQIRPSVVGVILMISISLLCLYLSEEVKQVHFELI
jgi:hypothetical protein